MKIIIMRLPDINSFRDLPEEYDNYGRFGFTNNGSFYVSPIHSSHAGNTKIGGYWATSKGQLHLSPRGSMMGFDKVVNDVTQNNYLNKILRVAGLRYDGNIEIQNHLRSDSFNEMSERDFSRYMTNKKLIVLSAKYGSEVDAQGSDYADKVFSNALKKEGYTQPILRMGRFGSGGRGWEFDTSMLSSGHPDHWESSSRGYYAMTKTHVFLFPKDNNFVQFHGRDIQQGLYGESSFNKYMKKIING